MSQPSAQLKTEQFTDLVPFEIIRTETVLSKLPIHNLAKRGSINIHITKRNEQGKIDLKWKVSPNRDAGEPRQLAYKIDTLVVNHHIDELGRPLPKIIRLGSLREIAKELGFTSLDTGKIKKALTQNATVAITAKLAYKGRDGADKDVEAVFTRYSVVFTGERLPGGTKADAVYLLLNELYWDVLNSAPDRPLDYAYLKALPPAAQRFYEIISFRIFAALKYKRQEAKICYSEYCTFSAQHRSYEANPVKKQMYKIHRPHLLSGYLANVRYEKALDSDGNADWVLYYTPGPKAKAHYKVFRKKRKDIGESPEEGGDKKPTQTHSSKALEATQNGTAVDLVGYFHELRGIKKPYPTKGELKLAQEWIDEHGHEKARYIIAFSHQAAQATNYTPRTLAGIQQYRAEALQDYDRQQEKQEQRAREKAQQQEQERQASEVIKAEEELLAQLSPEEYERFIQEAKEEIFTETPLLRKAPDSHMVNVTAKDRVIKKLREHTQDTSSHPETTKDT